MSSRSLNKVMLIGNLTRDPELRYLPQGTAVCSFGLATNRSWIPSDSTERKEEAEFHRIVAWNKLAEICSQLLLKGRKVYIEGRLQTRSWETPDGDKRQSTEVVVEDMMILDSRRPESQTLSAEVEEKTGAKKSTKSDVAVATSDTAGAKPDLASVKESLETPKEKLETTKEREAKTNPPALGEDSSGPKEDKEEKGENKIDIDDIPF